MALKRAQKAQHRKQVAVQRRQPAVVESPLAGRARRAALTPVRHCCLHGDVGEGGMANVVIARGASPYRLMVVFFLVDLHCLGIKDVIVHDMTGEELAAGLEDMRHADNQLVAVEPSYARKLLRDASAWAATIGFKPQRDFAAAEQIFGDVDVDACDATFTFGVDGGRPLYVPGPTETRAQIRQRLHHLRSRLGEDGFEFIIGL
jgi:hypothetical protein